MALLYNPTANITRLYFGTDTHAQSILIGSALACVLTLVELHRGNEGMAPVAHSPRWRVILVVLGVAGFAGTLILTYTLVGTSAIDYQGGFMISALSAAAIITGAVCVPGGVIAQILSLRPLVWLGTISYGAYLWHYPVYVYLDTAQTDLSGLPLLALRFGATIVLATASYYLVERPVMYGTFWRSLKALTPSVLLMGATVAVIVVGTLVPATAAVRVQNGLLRNANRSPRQRLSPRSPCASSSSVIRWRPRWRSGSPCTAKLDTASRSSTRQSWVAISMTCTPSPTEM
jgi:peptidoglycan/LPS O-acetylase OafA/YrhL